MLGAALIFVTLFRRLKLGATLGYIVAGALIGPHVLRLIRDPEQLTSVTEIGIALLLFIVGLELAAEPPVAAAEGYFRPRPRPGRACGLAISLLLYVALGISPGGGAGDRPSARPVIDRAGAADAAIGQ